jgi:hypothetical protein
MNKLIVLLAILCASCQAQEQVRAPVNVATELYKGCLNAALSNPHLEIEPNKPAINEFIDELDENCLGWTVIWFRPMIGYNLADRSDIVERFVANRNRIVLQLRKDLYREALLLNR